MWLWAGKFATLSVTLLAPPTSATLLLPDLPTGILSAKLGNTKLLLFTGEPYKFPITANNLGYCALLTSLPLHNNHPPGALTPEYVKILPTGVYILLLIYTSSVTFNLLLFNWLLFNWLTLIVFELKSFVTKLFTAILFACKLWAFISSQTTELFVKLILFLTLIILYLNIKINV